MLPCTPFNMDNQVRLRELARQDDIRCSTRSAGEEVEDYCSNLVQAAGRSPGKGEGCGPWWPGQEAFANCLFRMHIDIFMTRRRCIHFAIGHLAPLCSYLSI